MNHAHFARLLAAYRAAPLEFQATSYWAAYEDELLKLVRTIDFDELRSGKHRVLRAFGFADAVYHRKNTPLRRFLSRLLGLKERYLTPYSASREQIEEMAYRHCEIYGQLTGARPISSLSASLAGGPPGAFVVDGRDYTMPFLSYYLRYCFAQQFIPFANSPVLVELGSGSGYLVEVLKKLYPELTVLCFDLPGQVFLCENYLSAALGSNQIVTTETTLDWNSLSEVKAGRVHFFGNWQMPLLNDFKFDAFWNAASFGEMEPDVVRNYLSFVKGKARWIYLQQIRGGQKTSGTVRVQDPITLEMYKSMLDSYELLAEQDSYAANYRDAGGYFEAVWRAT